MTTMRTLWCLLSFVSITAAFSPLVGPTNRKFFVQRRGNQDAVAVASRLNLSAFELANDDSRLPTTLESTPRRIARVEKFARLPVWPVWNGVAIFVISKIFGEEVAAKLEDNIGGRVCPNFFQDSDQTSPFIMLVHHRHTFAAWDVLRHFQSTFFPEGFPAHPHRGKFFTKLFINILHSIRLTI